jgi:hypothetical protein
MSSEPLTWTKLVACAGCKLARECFACVDGWRCTRCRPKGWQPPPDASEWLRAHGGWVCPKATTSILAPVSPYDDDAESEVNAPRTYEKYPL